MVIVRRKICLPPATRISPPVRASRKKRALLPSLFFGGLSLLPSCMSTYEWSNYQERLRLSALTNIIETFHKNAAIATPEELIQAMDQFAKSIHGVTHQMGQTNHYSMIGGDRTNVYGILVDAFQSGNIEQQESALRAIGAYEDSISGRQVSIESLEKGFGSSSETIRQKTMALFNDPRFFNSLVGIAAKPNSSVIAQRAALEVIAGWEVGKFEGLQYDDIQYGNLKDISLQLSRLKRSTDVEVRTLAARALGMLEEVNYSWDSFQKYLDGAPNQRKIDLIDDMQELAHFSDEQVRAVGEKVLRRLPK